MSSKFIRLVRYSVPGQIPRLGICKEELIYEFAPSINSFEELLRQASAASKKLFNFVQELSLSDTTYRYQALDRTPDAKVPHLLMPIVPPEVWGAGVTYERSRVARGVEESATAGIYDKVYDAERPELFFKATPSRCVGPNMQSGIRADSTWTVPEPELGVVVGADGEVLAYSLGNDMNARDLEGANPLYLPQAKIHRACFSFGPALLLTDSTEVMKLGIWCSIKRKGSEVFHGETNTSHIHRPIAQMIDYLRRMDIPALTVLSTGTGIVPPTEFALQEDDVIEIGCDQIGVLRNPVIKVS
jgi:2-dehydro-3-deoxy-D-arabinonate dehydratase